MRTYIYIDGFNFYYGSVKDTPYKWLDFKKLCVQLLKTRSHNILSIKYFTALVSELGDPERPIRQKTYIRALESYIPELSIHYGHFSTHNVMAPLVKPINGKRFVEIIKTEEKGSDVNIAVHLLNDAWHDKYDCAIIISDDGDLSESIRLVKTEHKKLIGLFLQEKNHPSIELLKLANFVKNIRKGVLLNSQLPNPIPNTNIHKPKTWI